MGVDEISHRQAPQTHCDVFDNLNCQHLCVHPLGGHL